METFDSLVEYCRVNNRVCPQPNEWQKLWEMLPNKRQLENKWKPSLPLILGAWWETTDAEKRQRFEEHLQWAESHNCLEEIGQFVRRISETSWYLGSTDVK